MLKSFDVFPKGYNSELKVKTSLGGLLSLLSFAFLIINVYLELKKYTQTFDRSLLSVTKTPLPTEIPFNFDILVQNDCKDLHIDFTNQKRTFDIDAQYEHSLTQEGSQCRVKAKGNIPSIPGSFHIGLGKNYDKDGVHSHFTMLLTNRNLSHKINDFSFGEFTSESAINSTELNFEKDKAYMIVYQLQLVPVVSKNRNVGFQILADVTKRDMTLQRAKGIPGIIFEWDFSPLQLTNISEKTPAIYLISHLLGLFGSFFVFARWIDAFAFRIEQRFLYNKL